MQTPQIKPWQILSTDGQMIIAIPSNRTPAFLKRSRWESAEAALTFWKIGKYKSRFEHYRRKATKEKNK